MSSKSHGSFASRLGKAKNLQIIVGSFTNYVAPVPTASLATLTETITTIDTLQQQYNIVKSDYTTKTKERKIIFSENNNSIDKLLSPIRTFIEALKGKESTELAQITSLVNKIRGSVAKTFTKSTESETDSISQIERTYASRLANFKNIIDILSSLGEGYAPPNESISLEALNALATTAQESTTAVDVCLSVYKPIINERQTLYDTLRQQTQSIKNFIKAQFGIDSNEYSQVKKLVI